MNTKMLLIYFFIIATIACNGGSSGNKNYIEGVTAMTSHVELRLYENTEDEKVYGIATITQKPAVEYNYAELYIDGNIALAFDEGIEDGKFYPKRFGDDITLEFICYNKTIEDGNETKIEVYRNSETVSLHLQTWFVGYHEDLWLPIKKIDNGANKSFNSQYNPRGSTDICWVYGLRVPEGKSITLTYHTEKLIDSEPLTNEQLDVHFRLSDYANRNDLYIFPDEALYHIDKEIDKWIVDTITLNEGIHIVYVAPSLLHDLSKLTVYMQGDYSCSVFGFFKSIDFEGLGLLPEGVEL